MDRYTKGLLTIIAASFAVLACRAVDPPAITVHVRRQNLSDGKGLDLRE